MSAIGYVLPTPKVKINLTTWDKDAGLTESPTGRAIDLFLGMLFIVRVVIPGTNFYVGDAAILLLILFSLWRSAPLAGRLSSLYTTAVSIMLAYLALTSFLNDISFVKRAAKIAILLVLAGFVGTGRINVVQVIRGLGIGLLINIPIYLLHLTPDYYPGCLTGLIADKNVAGLYYAAGTLLMMMITRGKFARFVVFALGAYGVALTLSRTSLAALAFALVWLFLSRRAGFVAKLVYLGIVTFGYQFLESKYSTVGFFADRVGSDALRSRIDAATFASVSTTPWYGKGLGTATVLVNDHPFFFHNSYAALYVEGGVVVIGLALVSYAVFGLRVFGKPPFTSSEMYLQAASVVVLVSATRLGEVFFTMPSLLIIGAAMQTAARRRQAKLAAKNDQSNPSGETDSAVLTELN